MTLVALPFSIGLVTYDQEADWTDALPVNMIAVPRKVLGHSEGYMKCWPGLSERFATSGISRGVAANVVLGDIFRVQGFDLIDGIGTVLGNVGGAGHCAMPYSRNTQAIVSGEKLLFWDGSKITEFKNWEQNEHGQGDPATTFDLSNIIDATRNRSRYIAIQRGTNNFIISDLTNEQRPDYLAPFYSAESALDTNIGVSNWRGYVVVFGRYTTEYFSLTGTTEPVYQANLNLTVRAGIVGVAAKAEYADTFAILGGPEFKPPSIYLLGSGGYSEIATRKVQDIIEEYKANELALAIMETVKFNNHDILMVHLPRHVLIFDRISSDNEYRRWSILKTDVAGDRPYRGIYHAQLDTKWQVGDKVDGRISEFDFDISTHLGQRVGFELYTPLLQIRNFKLKDLELDNVSGRTDENYRLAIASTFDGLSYTPDYWIDFSLKNQRQRRVILRDIGYCQNNIGFRLRWASDFPMSVAGLKLERIDNGRTSKAT